MKSKATTRFLAALMALTMLLSCSVLAADIKVDAAAETEPTLISLSEANTVEVTVKLSAADLAAA